MPALRNATAMEEGDTLVNALIGGAVTFVAGNFVPMAPVFGGGVAGYLEGGDRMDGVRVGAYSGLIAFLPVLAFAFALTSIIGVGFGFGLFTNPEAAAGGLLGIAVLLFILVIAFVYFVGGGAAGGWLGNYVKYDTDVDL